ncbi:MAG: hypothetical protein ACLFVZ_11185 [Actinomycetota bacterium]
MAAILGVPTAVIMASGGWHTVGFWIVAVVWLATVVYGAILVSFILLLLLSPLAILAERVASDRLWDRVTTVAKVSVLVVAGGMFVAAARLGDVSSIRLPTPWPNLGAFLVIVAAAAASRALWSYARRQRPPKKTPAIERRHSVPEPDEEYWSPDYVVGWRAWNWDGSYLRGVHSRWPSETFEAACTHCDVVPSWDHVCGVYAAKRPGDVHIFYGGSWIIGRVEMWGAVIEHEYGYRASHARITQLWVGDPWRAERIGEAYPEVEVAVGTFQTSKKVS